MTSGEIADLERLSLKVFRAEHVLSIGGWVVLSSNVSARRANSIYPLGDPQCPVEEAMEAAVEFQRKHGKPALFKLASPSTRPHPIEHRLRSAGYQPEARTEMMVGGVSTSADISRVLVEEGSSDRWFADRATLFGLSVDQVDGLRAATAPFGCRVAFATVVTDRGIAQGQSTLVDGSVGVFNMFTQSGARRAGLARQILAALLAWGHEAGAERAFLQVEVGNEAARQLYVSAGFEPVYEYQYWRMVSSWLPSPARRIGT